MKHFLLILLISIRCAGLPTAAAQTNLALPLDPAITKGRLPNGVTYYVRTNAKPEKRA